MFTLGGHIWGNSRRRKGAGVGGGGGGLSGTLINGWANVLCIALTEGRLLPTPGPQKHRNRSVSKVTLVRNNANKAASLLKQADNEGGPRAGEKRGRKMRVR